jgi:hypothetical protein
LLAAFSGCPLDVTLLQRLSRAYTLPPPTGQAAPNRKPKHADNTLMYTTLGLVAAAGAYYYFRDTEEVKEFEDKVKAERDHMKRRRAELSDTADGRAEDVKQQGKAKWDQAKVSCHISQLRNLTHETFCSDKWQGKVGLSGKGGKGSGNTRWRACY